MNRTSIFFIIRTVGSVLVAFALFWVLAIFTLGAFPIILGVYPQYGGEVVAEVLLLVGTVIVFLIPGPGSIWHLNGRNKFLVPLASMVLVTIVFLGYGAFNKAKINSEEMQKLQTSIRESKTKYPTEWNKSQGGSSPEEVLLAFLDAQAKGDATLASQLIISDSNIAQGPYSDLVKDIARSQAETYRAGRYTKQMIGPDSWEIIIEPHYRFVAVQNSFTGKWNLWSY